MGKAALPATRSHLMHRKQSWKVYRMVLIWVITKFQKLRLYCILFLLLHQCSQIKSTVLRMSSCRQVPWHNRHNYTNLSQSCTVHVNDFKQLTTLWWCTSTLPQFHENSLKEIPSSTTKFQYRIYYNISEINVHKWQITASVCLLHSVHWLQS